MTIADTKRTTNTDKTDVHSVLIMDKHQLHYIYSCDLNMPIELKIVALDGRLPKLNYQLIADDLTNQQCACVGVHLKDTNQSAQENYRHTDSGDEQANTPDLFVTCSVWSDGIRIGDELRTAYKYHGASCRYSWNEWLTLPIRYSQLSLDAVLVLNLWDLHAAGAEPHCIGGTVLPLFSTRAVLRKGIYDLRLWPFTRAEGDRPDHTPGKPIKKSEEIDNIIDGQSTNPKNTDLMNRLSKCSKRHRAGQMPAVDWLDRMCFREIEQINEKHKRDTRQLYLVVEMANIHYKEQQQIVIYFEKYSDQIHHFVREPKIIQFHDPEIGLENLVEAKHRQLTRSARATSLDKELKPNALTRDQLDGILAISPIRMMNQEQRDLIWKFRYHLASNSKALPKFLQSVQWERTNEVKEAIDLLHTWSLISVEDALQLLSVDFTHASVRQYAVGILAKAPSSQLLLYLLQLVQALKYENVQTIEHGSDSSFVRSFMAHDSLNQTNKKADLWQTADVGEEATLLDVDADVCVITTDPLCSSVTSSDSTPNTADPESSAKLEDSRKSSTNSNKVPPSHTNVTNTNTTKNTNVNNNTMDLASFLIQAACSDATFANYFYWYLKVECEAYSLDLSSTSVSVPANNQLNNTQSSSNIGNMGTHNTTKSTTSEELSTRRHQTHQMYQAVLKRLSKALMKGGAEAKRRRAQLLQQVNFMDRMLTIMHSVAKESGNRKRKIEHLQSQLTAACGGTVPSNTPTAYNSNSSSNAGPSAQTLIGRALHQHDVTHTQTQPGTDWSSLQGMPLPLDPSIRVNQVLADRATLFNSALMPVKMSFLTVDGRDYVTIFKHGDDLRQDQLVVQMIELMDGLLRADNLDLRLTPYKVLATGLQHGFVQFVDSQPLRDVLQNYGTITAFFRYYRPSNTGPYGIETDVIENYVRSLAGYSVISYILGIGDRHLHNLLLCKNGRLFHVDFGYILGRDPKPMPPPMKLTDAMIEPIGGQQSPHWLQCRRYCYDSFLIIRRHANLILNLFALMQHASIPDIAVEPDRAAGKVEERLHLNLSDEEAVTVMQNVIDASMSAKMAVFVDLVHDLAQAFRN